MAPKKHTFAPVIINELHVAYGKADVLCGVNLEIRPGQVTCLLGANGAGKTTLIQAITGLMPTRSGTISFDSQRINGLAPHKIVALGISCIPEGRRVFPRMTVEENLLMGAYLEKDKSAIQKSLDDIYAMFPRLLERRAQYAGTMSGGEQAMVSIGRGLMGRPRLLVIDEPSLGLSPALVNDNFRVIRRICDEGTAVFLVEQNVRQTLTIAQYGYVLAQGRVVVQGTPEELKKSPQVRAAYFGVGNAAHEAGAA